MGENICKSYICEWLIFKIYKEFIQLNSKKQNKMNKKWAEKLSRHFPIEENNGQQVNEKMFKSLITRKMQISTAIRYHLTYLLEWLSSKRQEISIGKDVLKGDLCPVVRIQVDAATIENSMKVSLKKIELANDPEISLMGAHPKEMKTGYRRDINTHIHCIFIRRRQWHPTPVLLPRKSHGWRNLVGCSPWGHKESDMTKRIPFHFSLSCVGGGNGNPL